MPLTFIQLATFVAKWRKLALSDDDLRALETELSENPNAGNVVPGTGGLRKLRFAPPSQHVGKRGASRVVYAYFVVDGTIYFLVLYAKNEQSDMTPDERKAAARVLAGLEARHRNEREKRP